MNSIKGWRYHGGSCEKVVLNLGDRQVSGPGEDNPLISQDCIVDYHGLMAEVVNAIDEATLSDLVRRRSQRYSEWA